MVNKVILLGRLGKDPETRHTAANFCFCNFSIATSERKKEQTGEWKDHSEWHNVVTLGKVAESCSKYLKKGSQVFIEGKLQTRKWQDKEGNNRYATEILADNVRFLSGNKKPDAEDAISSLDSIANTIPATDFDDDDIPF